MQRERKDLNTKGVAQKRIPYSQDGLEAKFLGKKQCDPSKCIELWFNLLIIIMTLADQKISKLWGQKAELKKMRNHKKANVWNCNLSHLRLPWLWIQDAATVPHHWSLTSQISGKGWRGFPLNYCLTVDRSGPLSHPRAWQNMKNYLLLHLPAQI